MSNHKIKYGSIDIIPLEQIVSRTKVRLGLKDVTDYDDEIIMFINEAASSLGSFNQFIKTNCKLSIANGRAKLPHGLKRLYGVRMVQPPPDPQVSQFPPQAVNSIWPTLTQVWNQGQVYLERTFLDDCRTELGEGNMNNIQGIMEIVGDELRFPIPCDAEECIISYLSFHTDDFCMLYFHPYHERCFSEYAFGMMLKTYPSLNLADRENRWIAINDAMNTYAAQRRKIIAEDFATNWELNKYSVKRILHALLQNQNNPNLL